MAEPESERRGGNPERIGDILARFMRESGLLKTAKQNELIRAWRDVVGTGLAAHTKVRSFRSGVLTIAIDSAPLRQEMELFQREELTKALRERLSGLYVRELRFTL